MSFVRGMDDLPRLTTPTFIGIMVAISGNTLISLALNLQKLAHQRVKRKAIGIGRQRVFSAEQGDRHTGAVMERESLLLSPFNDSPHPESYGYGTTTSVPSTPRAPLYSSKRTLSPLASKRVKTTRIQNQDALREASVVSITVMTEEAASRRMNGKRRDEDSELGKEGDYLKSKLWWLGFALMNVGELGNFISYAYAPASVVAPLGTFALMANCVFAPLLLGEKFRKRDLLGIPIAIIGAVTVVLSTHASDTRLDPDALLRAVTQTSFIVFTCIYIFIAGILSTLSCGPIGQTWVIVDVGLCAIFGGFTVLCTKALSTLLTTQWMDVFTHWLPYPILVVLILTGVGQIRHLNRALMHFDSKIVIPIQFVLFTLSAIIGSAVLYGDFKRAKFHEIITFLYGCAATFAGVYIIAWEPRHVEGEENDTNAAEQGRQENPPSVPLSPERTRVGPRTSGKDSPRIRPRHSSLSLMGISPAQNLLLVHAPLRDVRAPDDEVSLDVGRDARLNERRGQNGAHARPLLDARAHP